MRICEKAVDCIALAIRTGMVRMKSQENIEATHPTSQSRENPITKVEKIKKNTGEFCSTSNSHEEYQSKRKRSECKHNNKI